MATASRVFWESVIFVAFLAILAGFVFWSSGRVERHAQSLTEQHQLALEAVDQGHRDEIARLNQAWDRISQERAKQRARAVFSAFEAGIHTAASARWGRYLDTAKDTLVSEPEVLFLHLATPQGRVITTSDDELAQIGRLDESGDWALAIEELSGRAGTAAGTFELAAPIVENDQIVAILWMGYDLAAITTASDS